MPKTKASDVQPLAIEELTAIGFKPTVYEGQDGTFYTQTVRVSAMPWWKNSDLRNVVHGNTKFVTETNPERTCIQVCMLNDDSFADAGTMFDVNSDEGRTLLEDARKAWEATHAHS